MVLWLKWNNICGKNSLKTEADFAFIIIKKGKINERKKELEK